MDWDSPSSQTVGGSQDSWWPGVSRAAAPTRHMRHVTLRMISLGCRPPALPHSRKPRDSGHLGVLVVFLAHPGRRGSLHGGPYPEFDRGRLGASPGVRSPKIRQLVAWLGGA